MLWPAKCKESETSGDKNKDANTGDVLKMVRNKGENERIDIKETQRGKKHSAKHQQCGEWTACLVSCEPEKTGK